LIFDGGHRRRCLVLSANYKINTWHFAAFALLLLSGSLRIATTAAIQTTTPTDLAIHLATALLPWSMQRSANLLSNPAR
jgi:hypothetical protein